MKSLTARKSKMSQTGASLLEAIAFLGVAAMVILGAVALLLTSFGSAQTNRAEQEITAIQTGVKKLYMGQSASYGTGTLDAALIHANVFPTTLTVDGSGNVFNGWNGAVDVEGNSASFTISYASVPRDACINLASANGDWLGVSINGTDVTLPVTPATADAACTADSNIMVWTAA
jgi:hypothetical protein